MAVLVFVGGLALTPFLGKEFVPAADEDQFNVQVETPIGTSIEATAAVLAEIERRLRGLPGVTGTFTTIGAGAEGRVNVATVLTQLVPKAERPIWGSRTSWSLARQQLADLTHLKISVEDVPRVGGGGFRSAPVQYNVRGADLRQLVDVAGQDGSRRRPGARHRRRQLDLRLRQAGSQRADRPRPGRRPGRLGRGSGQAIRTLIGGEEVTTFEEGGETYDVRVRLAEVDRDRPEAILGLPVRTENGQLHRTAQPGPRRGADRAGADRPAGSHAAGHRHGQPGEDEAAGRGTGGRSPDREPRSACRRASPRRSPATAT